MGLSAKLQMRQGQSLTMTPQLLQAIKLLQLSTLELSAYIEAEVEKNPLLERSEDVETGGAEIGGEPEPADEPREWDSQTLETGAEALEAALDTDFSNTFEADRIPAAQERLREPETGGLSDGAWAGAGGGAPGSSGGFDHEAPDLEAYVAQRLSLADHLNAQLALATADPGQRLIGATLIDALDEDGYARCDLGEIAERLGSPLSRVEETLALLQTFEPTGVAARDLAECLALQLKERDRFDPAMAALVAHLPLLARRDYASLRKLCGVEDEDLVDMAAELRRLDPRPGRAFGAEPATPVTPDVLVQAAPDGSWRIDLNADALPRVLVNATYAALISAKAASEADRAYVSGCLQSANWLTRSLDQRARTILKVASEIVRQQDGFLAHGVEHLRPLNLKTVADAIGMHESTVSRVTSGKHMATPRGLFELKYFFSAAIKAADGGEAHSSEAVRSRIKAMIEAENPDETLSDDALVARLREEKIEIARRTVAKYRESLRIPSSVERRREKRARTPAAASG